MFYVTPMEEDTFKTIIEHRAVYNAVFCSSTFLEAHDYALALKKCTGLNYTVSELIFNIWSSQTIDEARKEFKMGTRLICADGETRLKDVR